MDKAKGPCSYPMLNMVDQFIDSRAAVCTYLLLNQFNMIGKLLLSVLDLDVLNHNYVFPFFK